MNEGKQKPISDESTYVGTTGSANATFQKLEYEKLKLKSRKEKANNKIKSNKKDYSLQTLKPIVELDENGPVLYE